MHTDDGPKTNLAPWHRVGSSRLVGRRHELDLLSAALEDCGCAVVDGEAGAGKTRLLSELVTLLAEEGRDYELVTAVRSSIPFAPFVHLLEPSAVPAQDPTEHLARMLLAVRRRAATGAVLLVDDAHLLDAGSVALLHQLASRREIPMVLALRPDHEDGVLATITTGLANGRIVLAPLSRSETDELVGHLSDGDVDPDEVWRLSAGHPLFVNELVALARSDERWSEPTSYTRSLRLREVIGSRLDRLASTQRAFLEVVAVAGTLPRSAAERLLPLEEIAVLERSGLVRLGNPGGVPTVSPGHDLHREMAVALAGQARIELARRSAVDALEYVGDETSSIAAARLRLDAGLLDPEPLERASELAFLRFDPLLAREFAAGATGGGSPFLGPLLEASALGALGQFDDAIRRLDQLRRWVTEPSQVVQVTLAHARAELMWRGDQEAGEQILRHQIAAVGPDHDAPLRVLLASVMFYTGRPAAAVDVATPLLELDEFPVGAVVPLACVWAVLGDPDGVLGVIDLLLDALRRHGHTAVDPIVMLTAPFVWLLAKWQRGELRGAHAFDPYQGATAHPALDSATCVLMPAAGDLMTGHLDDMLDAYRDHSETVDLGSQQVVAMHRILLVMMHSLRGELDEARARRDELAQLPPQIVAGFPWWVARADVLLQCAEGDRTGAVTRSIELADIYAEEQFHRAVSLHDVVRMGRAELVVEDLDLMERRVGATWFDRAVAAHARATAAGDRDALIAASRTFEAGGLDLYALEAAAQAARVAATPALAQAPLDDVTRLLAVCGRVRTPAVLSAPAWLTDREVEVASLAASGLTNKEIATRLGTSARTVGNQLQSVYHKLGVSSRQDLVDLW